MSVLVCTSINAVAPLAIVGVCRSFFPLLGTLAGCYNVCFYGTEKVHSLWKRENDMGVCCVGGSELIMY